MVIIFIVIAIVDSLCPAVLARAGLLLRSRLDVPLGGPARGPRSSSLSLSPRAATSCSTGSSRPTPSPSTSVCAARCPSSALSTHASALSSPTSGTASSTGRWASSPARPTPASAWGWTSPAPGPWSVSSGPAPSPAPSPGPTARGLCPRSRPAGSFPSFWPIPSGPPSKAGWSGRDGPPCAASTTTSRGRWPWRRRSRRSSSGRAACRPRRTTPRLPLARLPPLPRPGNRCRAYGFGRGVAGRSRPGNRCRAYGSGRGPVHPWHVARVAWARPGNRCGAYGP